MDIAEFAPEGTSGEDLNDFGAAFGETLSRKAEPRVERFSAENEEPEEDNTDHFATEEKVIEKKEEPENLDDIERRQKEAREKWKLQKELKDMKAELAALKGSPKEEAKNPFTGKSKDDIVAQALAALEDDGMTTEEAKDELSTMTPAQIIAKVKEEMKRKQEEERAREEEQRSAKEGEANFKKKIIEQVQSRAEEFPLVEGLGGVDAVYRMIEEDFAKKEAEFGSEFAQENIMKLDTAIKKVNETLASEVRSALKSTHLRKFIMDALKEEAPNQLKDKKQSQEDYSTLSNSLHRKVTDPVDVRQMDDEEALNAAFNYL
jgi:hypothetical protein